MAEPILNASGVVAGIGQRVAARVAQHVGVNRKRESGALADPLISRLTASGVNGPPRSVLNTKAESGDWLCNPSRYRRDHPTAVDLDRQTRTRDRAPSRRSEAVAGAAERPGRAPLGPKNKSQFCDLIFPPY
jgi:ribosomal protein S13